MPELKGHLPPPTTRQSEDNKQGATLLILILILLGLLLIYWILTRPPQIISAKPTRGITSVFSIYGINRKDLLKEPNAVYVRGNGDIYVADTGNDRVVVFDSQGRFKSEIVKKARKNSKVVSPGDLVTPLGVAVDGRGRIYTTSLASGIMIFDQRGRAVRQLPIPSIQPYVKGNKVYVTTPSSIYVFNSRDDIVQHIGSKGRKPGQFETPNDLMVDKASGNIIVSDSQNMRLQVFKAKGDPLFYKGTPPQGLNDAKRLFGLGTGITEDDAGRIYVADALAHSIRIFDKKGNDLGELGDKGTADGLFDTPTDIFFMGGNTFAIADKWNDRVQIVRLNPGEARRAGTEAKPGGQGLPKWAMFIGLLILLAIIALASRRYMARPRYGQALPG